MWDELVSKLLQLMQQLVINKIDLRPCIVIFARLWGLTRYMFPLNQMLHFDQHFEGLG